MHPTPPGRPNITVSCRKQVIGSGRKAPTIWMETPRCVECGHAHAHRRCPDLYSSTEVFTRARAPIPPGEGRSVSAKADRQGRRWTNVCRICAGDGLPLHVHRAQSVAAVLPVVPPALSWRHHRTRDNRTRSARRCGAMGWWWRRGVCVFMSPARWPPSPARHIPPHTRTGRVCGSHGDCGGRRRERAPRHATARDVSVAVAHTVWVADDS